MAKTVRKVIADDGSEHATMAAAKEHEANLARVSAVMKVVDVDEEGARHLLAHRKALIEALGGPKAEHAPRVVKEGAAKPGPKAKANGQAAHA